MKNAILAELMDTSVKTLAQKQRAALTSHCLAVLDLVWDALQREDYPTVRDLLSFSPAGDCMGCDNYFINFAWQEEETKPLDIGGVLEDLEALKKQETAAPATDEAEDDSPIDQTKAFVQVQLRRKR
jgi:hypothetical protein